MLSATINIISLTTAMSTSVVISIAIIRGTPSRKMLTFQILHIISILKPEKPCADRKAIGETR